MLLVALITAAVLAQQPGHELEREPNGVRGQANVATLGDTLLGEIVAQTDTDFFAIDIPAGTTLLMERTRGTVTACLIDADGVTRLGCFKDDVETRYFGYQIVTGGRYYMRMSTAYPDAEVVVMGPYGIAINLQTFPLGSADPPRTLVALDGSYVERYRLAAGYGGEMFALVIDRDAPVLRIDNAGTVSRFVTGVRFPTGGFAVDAFGALLVSGDDNGDHSIWTVSPNGEKTKFASHLGKNYLTDRFSIAIGPDGDVWAGEVNTLWRFSATGRLKTTYEMPNVDFFSLAVSPTGVVYFAQQYGSPQGIKMLTDNGPSVIMADTVGDLAFDRNGRLYVTVWDRWAEPYSVRAHVIRLDAEGRRREVVAHLPGLQNVIFPRDAMGAMTSRLVGVQVYINRIVELNEESRPPGRDTRRFHRFATQPMPAAVLGEAYPDTRVAAVGLAWSLEQGTLPPGLDMSAEGVIRGIPADTGIFTVTLRGEGTDVWVGDAVFHVSGVAISESRIVDALLGGPPLPAALVEFLDRHGNHDGRLDVGDLRAHLRANGLLR